jgi:hypothetical protein
MQLDPALLPVEGLVRDLARSVVEGVISSPRVAPRATGGAR